MFLINVKLIQKKKVDDEIWAEENKYFPVSAQLKGEKIRVHAENKLNSVFFLNLLIMQISAVAHTGQQLVPAGLTCKL